MDTSRRTIPLLLLLSLTPCFKNQRVFVEKRVGPGADVTVLCNADTHNLITTVMCKIQRGRNGADVCHLRYIPEQRNESDCGSRITLRIWNHTVSLHMTDLRPQDSGMYTCACYRDEIITLNFNVIVEDSQFVPADQRDQSTADKNNYTNYTNYTVLCSSVTAFIVIIITICGVTVGCVWKRRRSRKQLQSGVKGGEETETYAALQKPNNDLYQTIVKENSAAVSGSRHQRSHREREYKDIKSIAK